MFIIDQMPSIHAIKIFRVSGPLRSEVEIGGRGPSRTLVVMSITSPDGVREMGWHLSVRIPTASHVEEGVEERNLRWTWCSGSEGANEHHVYMPRTAQTNLHQSQT